MKLGKMEHDHSACSNREDSMATFTGCRVVGYYQTGGKNTLVFECGWGFTFQSSNGAYWTDTPTEVQKVIGEWTSRLQRTGSDLRKLLELAGVTQ